MSEQNGNKINICTVIPVYNNAETIKAVIDDALQYNKNLIVVDDGSNDAGKDIISAVKNIHLVRYAPNRGKGYALRSAFEKARELGYTHVVCMDADGQHLAKDLPAFDKAIHQNPEAVIIGARTFDSENIPGGSSFGRKFSNFWFRAETGIKLTDTQSGFRAYPLLKMQKFNWITKRYEFEIESIVRFAWRGGTIKEIPVSVYYPKPEDRVSHFRPYKDFFRISVLNSLLVIIALLYGLPRRIFHVLQSYSFKEFWQKHIAGSTDSNLQISKALGMGIFFGIIPLWGWQTILALTASHYFKLNKAFVILAANISLPPMMPFIIFGSFYTGSLVMNSPLLLSFNQNISLESIGNNLLQYIIGSMVLAVVAGLVVFLLSRLILQIFRKEKKHTL